MCKPQFYSKLQFEDDGGLPFVLLSGLTYVTDVDHRCTFIVPAGFKTDLASIPRGFWNILPQVGKYDPAAVVHDFLYQTAAINGRSITRGQADAILLEAMNVQGVGRWTRTLIYSGVRIGGWKTWNKYRARS